MQGMTVSRPSLAYADRLARMQGADYYNLSVGGMTACRQLGKFAMEYHWDRMFLCFGVNDFNLQRPVADFIADMTGILEETADRPVVLLSPIQLLEHGGASEGLERNTVSTTTDSVLEFP